MPCDPFYPVLECFLERTNWLILMWLKAAWTDLHNFFWRTTSGQSWLFSAMHNFPPRLRYVTRLPQNTLATEKAHCFPRVHWLWKDRGWRDHPTIDKFQYYLKFQVLTDVSDAPSWLNIEASNEITFSAIPAVHGLRPPGRLSTKSVSWCFISSLETLHLFQLLLGKFFGNFYAVYSSSS